MGDGSLGDVNVGMRGDGSYASFGRNMAAPRNALLLHSAGKEGNSEMTGPTPFVFVIDDDESVRKGLKRLLRSANYESEVFKSASDFLARPAHPGPACVIVDVQMPGINGIDFQQALIQRRREEQLVFITGYGTIPMCTRVMKAGAVDFLPKPFNSRELLKCVEQALHRSAEQRRRTAERHGARRLLDLLTPREFEVMQLVITGMLNKQVGGELGVAEKTVKVHRGRLMQKLGVTSVAELVQLVQKAEVPSPAGSETKV
jgi:FixJ family two-component response regulator